MAPKSERLVGQLFAMFDNQMHLKHPPRQPLTLNSLPLRL